MNAMNIADIKETRQYQACIAIGIDPDVFILNEIATEGAMNLAIAKAQLHDSDYRKAEAKKAEKEWHVAKELWQRTATLALNCYEAEQDAAKGNTLTMKYAECAYKELGLMGRFHHQLRYFENKAIADKVNEYAA